MSKLSYKLRESQKSLVNLVSKIFDNLFSENSIQMTLKYIYPILQTLINSAVPCNFDKIELLKIFMENIFGQLEEKDILKEIMQDLENLKTQ